MKPTQTQVLYALYKKIFGEDFNCEDIKHKIRLQKVAFLLYEKRVPCGAYAFVWDKYGPFSAELSDDMKKIVKTPIPEIDLREPVDKAVDEISAIIKDHGEIYDIDKWLEAIASIWYMKRYMHPTFTDGKLASKLHEYKDYLDSNKENQRAMKVAKAFFQSN